MGRGCVRGERRVLKPIRQNSHADKELQAIRIRPDISNDIDQTGIQRCRLSRHSFTYEEQGLSSVANNLVFPERPTKRVQIDISAKLYPTLEPEIALIVDDFTPESIWEVHPNDHA